MTRALLAPKFSAVILAGGKSSRMGRDKAWLEIDGQTLLARQLALAQTAGATEVFISGQATVDYSAFGCRVLQDRFPNAGPLAGIERALDAMTTPLSLVLAVDMPAIPIGFLKQLGASCSENCGVVPQVHGRIEPLAAFYPKAGFHLAEALLSKNRTASEATPGPTEFVRRCVRENLVKLVEVTVAETCYFTNLNSPRDLTTPNNSVL